MTSGKRTVDRRVQKTQKLLHEALGSLIQEKPYDDIVVKEILDRANVGRSTFYMHFSDKDELLAKGIYQLLQTVSAGEMPASGKKHERILRFSMPVFEHIHRHRQAKAVGMGSRGWAIVHEHLQRILTELIADDVGKLVGVRQNGANQISPDLLAQYLASTFVLVLNWWVESKDTLRPKEADNLFRTLTIPTLSACIE